MGNPQSTSRGQQETMADSNVIDFYEMVLAWAKDVAPKRFSSRSDTEYDVNWERMRINTGKPKYDGPKVQKPVSSSVILTKSSIENDTKNSQENEVVMEGTYTATTSITLSQAFNIAEKTNLDLSLPDEMVKAGFEKTLTITKIEKHRQTKEQTWRMTTKVKVPPGEKKTVEQTITVNQYSSTFSVPTEISGKVHVTIYKKMGAEKKLLMSLEPKKIVDIMTYLKGQYNRYQIPETFMEIKESSVCVTTKGECEFMYGVEQNVNTTTKQEEAANVQPSCSEGIYPQL